MKKTGLFAAGVLLGTAGLKMLGSKDAKKVYAHTTASVLRAKDCVMTAVTAVREGAGIAIATGAAIAKEISDITIASEDLSEPVTLRRLSEALMRRIHGSYRFIVGFNLSLIVLGVAGIVPPTTSALLHNTSTLGISLKNMSNLLDKSDDASVDTVPV